MIAVCIDKNKEVWDLFGESAITYVQILKHSVRIILNSGNVSMYTDWEGCKGEKLTKENMAHFKACLLENAIGGNTNVFTDDRYEPGKVWVSGEINDANRMPGGRSGTTHTPGG